MQRLSVEIDRDKHGEYRQRDDFLNHLQLHDVERTAVAVKADAVGGNLAAVFGQCQQPRQEDDDIEWGIACDDVDLLQLQVTVPGEGHEDIGYDQ